MAKAIKEYYKDPKHEGGKTFWNVSNYLPIDKASRPSNIESSWVTFGGPQILEEPSVFTSRTNVQYHLTSNRIERFILQQQQQQTPKPCTNSLTVN